MNSFATLFPRWVSIGRWHAAVAGLLVATLGVLSAAGFGPGGSACKALSIPTIGATSLPAIPDVKSNVPAAASAASAVAAPAPAPTVVPPSAKLYFGLGRSDVNAEAVAALGGIIAFMQANPDAKALVSGFHDTSGPRATNEEVAFARARSVQAALLAAGIADARVVLAKPAESTGTGSPSEARRVEVTVQP